MRRDVRVVVAFLALLCAAPGAGLKGGAAGESGASGQSELVNRGVYDNQTLFRMASEQARQGDYRGALEWTNRALAGLDKPTEPWLRLAAQLNLALERFGDARPLLEELMRRWPGKQYAMQLALVYGETRQRLKRLVLLEYAYLQRWLASSGELEQLCQAYVDQGLAYKCARLAEQHMADGSMDKSAKNWEMLANAWLDALERERAIEPLEHAAERSESGMLYMQLGQLHVDAGRWERAEQALRNGLGRGGLKNPGLAKLLIGVTHFERQSYAAARDWFQQAAQHSATRNDASTWLESVEQRTDALAAGGGS
jgi:tetratricopeptide (TPR) repeat protein